MVKVVPFPRRRRPQTFTEAEQVIEYISDCIHASNRGYREMSEDIGVARTTLNNIATRKTRWPRPTTLFPLLKYFGIKLTLNQEP